MAELGSLHRSYSDVLHWLGLDTRQMAKGKHLHHLKKLKAFKTNLTQHFFLCHDDISAFLFQNYKVHHYVMWDMWILCYVLCMNQLQIKPTLSANVTSVAHHWRLMRQCLGAVIGDPHATLLAISTKPSSWLHTIWLGLKSEDISLCKASGRIHMLRKQLPGAHGEKLCQELHTAKDINHGKH